MGNCQAIDAAALVIQHPSGRIERLYWPVLASEVMKLNPGHYVSLIIPLPNDNTNTNDGEPNKEHAKHVHFTKVKLLRPSETLSLGHAYRLVTTQEVIKVLQAKKYAKMKKQQHLPDFEQHETENKVSSAVDPETEKKPELQKQIQVTKQERQRPRTKPKSTAAVKTKSWQPALDSISEARS